MLKDEIEKELNKVEYEDEGQMNDLIPEEIKGEVEIKAWKNGKLFYHDGGDNTVTLWSRHVTMHMLTGDSFTQFGTTNSGSVYYYCRPEAASHAVYGSSIGAPGKNYDGYLVSGEQYCYDYTTKFTDQVVNRTAAALDGGLNKDVTVKIYPFFPTKMLFGTGFEYTSWADVPVAYQNALIAANFNETIFNTYLTTSINQDNYYSNEINLGTATMSKCRTINDIYSGSLSSSNPDYNEANYPGHYAIQGAVKNNLMAKCLLNKNNYTVTDTQILNSDLAYVGIGSPCYVYAKKSTLWSDPTSEVALKSDDSVKENRIVFTVVLPEQIGDNADYFYPYNGWTLKQAGLFSDARLNVGNRIPTGIGDADYLPYKLMPNGIMMAKRNISPITKMADVRISISWSLYLSTN